MKDGRSINDLAVEIQRQASTKKDYIANTAGVEVIPYEGDVAFGLKDVGEFKVNKIAHDQVATHTKIPTNYYERCRKEAPELLGANIREWFKKYPAPRMFRTLDGRNRAFLSDKYQPFDNNDFVEAVLPVLADKKLNIMSCDVTDTRLYIKAVDEKMFSDVPVGYKMGDGTHKIFDTCAPAIILSNSEVGFGKLVIETGVYTRACTNLALFASGGMTRRHVGARHKLLENADVSDLEDVLSAAAKKKTMEALWLQVRDVIAASFNEGTVKRRLEQIEASTQNKITAPVTKVIERVQERFLLSDGERESVLAHLITGGSLTQYGLQAAITRAAQDVESYDRSTEMEYLGGKVIELPRNDWAVLAEAA